MDIREGLPCGRCSGLGESTLISGEFGTGDDFLEGDTVPRRTAEREDDNAASRESSVSVANQIDRCPPIALAMEIESQTDQEKLIDPATIW